MKILAIYPGTFDPIHYGHMDIAQRAARMFDELLVGVYDKPLKSLLFSPEQRIELARATLTDLGLTNVRVQGYSGLTVQFARAVGAQVMIRGLRVFSDFEHEFRMALANHRLEPGIETVPLITGEQHSFMSSSTVREIASLNGDVSSMVPARVDAALKQRLRELGDESGRVVPLTSLRD